MPLGDQSFSGHSGNPESGPREHVYLEEKTYSPCQPPSSTAHARLTASWPQPNGLCPNGDLELPLPLISEPLWAGTMGLAVPSGTLRQGGCRLQKPWEMWGVQACWGRSIETPRPLQGGSTGCRGGRRAMGRGRRVAGRPWDPLQPPLQHCFCQSPTTAVWPWPWKGASLCGVDSAYSDHVINQGPHLLSAETVLFLEKLQVPEHVPLWKLPQVLKGCPGSLLQGIWVQSRFRSFVDRCLVSVSSGSIHLVWAEFAGSTAKSILKSRAVTTGWGREDGTEWSHVKMKQREGQGTSRFGVAS